MKQEQIYQQLTELAEKLQITVSERNLRQRGIRARSGLCRVRGESLFIMEKNAPVRKKIRLLADCLSQHSLEEIYLVPAVREIIEKHRSKPDFPDEGEPEEKDDAQEPPR